MGVPLHFYDDKKRVSFCTNMVISIIVVYINQRIRVETACKLPLKGLCIELSKWGIMVTIALASFCSSYDEII